MINMLNLSSNRSLLRRKATFFTYAGAWLSVCLVLVAISTRTAIGDDQGEIAHSRRNAIVKAVERVGPAVVTVAVMQTRIVREIDPFFGEIWGSFGFLGRRRKLQIPGLGSGVIFDQRGYILTNEHVIEAAEKIVVTLPDGRQFPGKVLGADHQLDIAILQISGADLPVAELGDSDSLMLGEWVIAVGNPFGFLINEPQPSVSVGVVSALDRSFVQGERDGRLYKGMTQTDAAINPGNSGGPLVNAAGEIVGVNTFIFSKTGGYQGISFAISISEANWAIAEILKYGGVRKVDLGFWVGDLTPWIVQELGAAVNEGVVVEAEDRSSPAWKAGLRPGDIILEVNGEAISNKDDTQLVLGTMPVGTVVTMVVDRAGEEKTITFTPEAK